jgi:hypothetical protein
MVIKRSLKALTTSVGQTYFQERMCCFPSRVTALVGSTTTLPKNLSIHFHPVGKVMAASG